MDRYVTKPAEVEAVQLTEDADWEVIAEWCGGRVENRSTAPGMDLETVLVIRTDTGRAVATEGYWVIRGTEGEFYPCLDSVFKRKYRWLSGDGFPPLSTDEVSVTATRETWQGIVNSILAAKQEWATNAAEAVSFDAEADLITKALGEDR
jgi:hypothetical protein